MFWQIGLFIISHYALGLPHALTNLLRLTLHAIMAWNHPNEQKGHAMTLASFASDYQTLCHPAILERLAATSKEPHAGYGTDEICASARKRIQAACGCPDAAVHFLVGGTQTNAVVLDALLRPWECVVAATTGHIATHEAGAIERGGHKVATLEGHLGKISAAQVAACASAWQADENHDHVVEPGVVYLSQPTEYGTLYTLSELEEMRRVTNENGMRLYVDGARLAYALASPANDVGLRDLARLTDAFYIGGTKCGALLGEAVVFSDPACCPRFFTLTKQHGALLAKGWVLGIQFDTLFEDDLYLEIGRPAIEAADRVRSLVTEAGLDLAFDTPTNQVFVTIADDALARLAERVSYSFWEKPDEDHTLIRLATSWATTPDDLATLAEALATL